jgi:hypothetical protein
MSSAEEDQGPTLSLPELAEKSLFRARTPLPTIFGSSRATFIAN